MPIQFNLARYVTTPRHEMTEGLGSSSAVVTDVSSSAPQELDPVVLSPEAIAALKSITPVPLEERLKAEDPKIQKILDKIYENDPKVSKLSISSRGITDDQLILILEALKTNTHITSLNLLGNKIGDEGAAALAENTTITNLDLHNNNIGAEGAIALAQNSTIITLNLRENKI